MRHFACFMLISSSLAATIDPKLLHQNVQPMHTTTNWTLDTFMAHMEAQRKETQQIVDKKGDKVHQEPQECKETVDIPWYEYLHEDLWPTPEEEKKLKEGST